jgi:hypothetical protein
LAGCPPRTCKALSAIPNNKLINYRKHWERNHHNICR